MREREGVPKRRQEAAAGLGRHELIAAGGPQRGVLRTWIGCDCISARHSTLHLLVELKSSAGQFVPAAELAAKRRDPIIDQLKIAAGQRLKQRLNEGIAHLAQ